MAPAFEERVDGNSLSQGAHLSNEHITYRKASDSRVSADVRPPALFVSPAHIARCVADLVDNVTTMVIGGAVAFLAIIFLLLAVTGGLALMILATDAELHAIWIAPLIVGLVIAAIAAVMILTATETLASTSLVPHQTIETLKEDKQWAQSKVQ